MAELIGDGRTAVPREAPRAPNQGIGRRPLLVGGAAAAIAAAGALIWWPRGADKPSAEAQVLLQKALAIMQDGRPAEQNQAIAYLIEVTRIAPQFANGWATLALGYAIRKFQVPLPALATTRAAARPHEGH